MSITPKQKELYKKIGPMLGTDARVIKYMDEINVHTAYVLECPDPTDDTVQFYATIGLCEFPIDSLLVELLYGAYTSAELAGNMVSTCAFFIIKDQWKVAHGTVFETLVEMYYPDSEMKHLYFTTPFLWEDKLEGFTVQDEAVHFFLAIPISDAELGFKNKNGTEAFEELLQNHDIDIFDVYRKSII